MKTAMQELHKHFIDAWSSPGDCWNPGKVIDKIESMIEKEKEQIIQAHIDGFDHIVVDFKKQEYAEQYYNQTYNQNNS
jgi:hypothetical protein